jgi:hypothetical protein
VFDAEAEGTYADFRNRELAWYDAVAKLTAEGQTDIRLCITPKQ